MGESYVVRGKIVLCAGFDRAVRVSVSGWPVEWPVPSVDVPTDSAAFALPLRWPTANMKTDVTKLELVAHKLSRSIDGSWPAACWLRRRRCRSNKSQAKSPSC
ncbi:MAG: hypothetical protein QM757_28220 [Paludibaculum sp.]